MKRPTFLTLDEVLALHVDQVERYDGEHGVRDVGLLESAIAMPHATLSGRYLHDGVTEMAAAYLYHLVRNHPFLDGNKRAGLMAALVFLGLNGLELEADANRLTDLVLGVAAGKVSKAETTVFIEHHSRARRA